VPPLFALCDPVFSETCEGIVKNKRSRLKRQTVVLPLVDPVLFIVPFKPHRYTKCITHRRADLRDRSAFTCLLRKLPSALNSV
jgi:hypothetical protein